MSDRFPWMPWRWAIGLIVASWLIGIVAIVAFDRATVFVAGWMTGALFTLAAYLHMERTAEERGEQP